MNPILGYFLFYNLGDGCLGSKYGHTSSIRLCAESATRVSNEDPADIYIGQYIVTCLDDVNPVSHTQARLIIDRKPNSISNLYILDWIEEGAPNNILYQGEGTLSGDVLIGSYWNLVVQRIRPTV